MMDARRQAYLEALDIPVWVRRDRSAAPAAPGLGPQPAAMTQLAVTPGSSGLLLVCRSQAEAASRLAGDIARSVRPQPGWAWPRQQEGAMTLGEAVDEHLFTGLLVFGADLADSLLGAQRPDRVGQARVWVVDGLDGLLDSAPARSSLWRLLCEKRLAAMA